MLAGWFLHFGNSWGHFYPRPVLASWYCCWLRPSIRPSVRHQVCPHDNSTPKLGSPNLDHRCKRPWLRSLLFWGWLTLTFKVKFNFNSKFTPFWACPWDSSSPIQARATKFRPEVQNTLVKIPIVLGFDWAWHVKFNLFSKSCWFASLLRLWNICETCKNGWKQSLFHILNGCVLICSPTGLCHGPWNSPVVSLVWPFAGFPLLDSAIGEGFLNASVWHSDRPTWDRKNVLYIWFSHFTLTHWGRDKIDAILQTTFSNAISWMKMFEFQLNFHWSLFLKVQLTIFQHWFR